MTAALNFATDFADQAVILPLAIVLAVGLWLLGWRRGGIAVLLATAATLGAMAVLKIVFAACAGPELAAALRSPSGHTAAAGLTAGAVLALLPPGKRGPAAWLLALLLPASIGATRLALGVHDAAEVLLGGAVGVAGGALLVVMAGSRPPGLRLRRLALAMVAIVLVLHGLRLPAEAAIRRVALLGVWPLSLCRAHG